MEIARPRKPHRHARDDILAFDAACLSSMPSQET
jgi:hypothetical protein